MSITTTLVDGNIAVVTMDHPPVNALPVAGWFDLADAIDEAGRDLAPTSSSSAPRARASTPAWTSRRCRRPRASTL